MRGRLFFSLAVLLIAGAAQLPGWLPGWLPAGPWGVLRACAGLGLALLVPGLSFLPLLGRACRGPVHPLFGLMTAVLGTVLSNEVAHTALTLSGLKAQFWSMWLSSCGAFVVAEAAARRWGAPARSEPSGDGPESPRERGLWWRAGLAGGLVIAAFSVALTQPRFVELDRYWSEEIYTLLSRLQPIHRPGAAREVRVSPGPGLEQEGERSYRFTAGEGSLVLENTTGADLGLQLPLVLHNTGAGPIAVRVSAGSRTLNRGALIFPEERDFARPDEEHGPPDRVMVPALVDLSRQPRNRPPPLRLVGPRLTLRPGTSRVTFSISGAAGAWQGVRLHDLSRLHGPSLARVFFQRFFVGDLGDIYETLDFARNYRGNWLQSSSSYDGDRFDGGGPTSLSDEPPGHHFLCFLALTYIRDSITSVSALYLAELLLLALVLAYLAARENPGLRWWHLLPLLAVALGYTRLCRLGLESNAPDTLFLLVWLAAMAGFLDGKRPAALVLAALAMLVHIPAPQAAVLLGAAAVLATRRREGVLFAAQALALIVAVMAARYLLIAAEVGLDRAWASGQAEMLGGNRLSALRGVVLEGMGHRLGALLQEAGSFALVALVASAGAGLLYAASLLLPRSVRPAEPDPRASTLFLFGLLYFAAMCLVDIHRNHHLGPIVFPLALALTRRIPQLRGGAKTVFWAASLLAAGAALGVLLAAGADPFDLLNPFHLGHYEIVPAG